MDRRPRITAVLLAAGRGERLGRDKALVPLGQQPAVVVLADRCSRVGCDEVVVVRQTGAEAVPTDFAVRVVEVASEEMIESARCAVERLADEPPHGVLVLPIDYAMVGEAALEKIVTALRAARDGALVLPICRGRPGHPIGLTWQVAEEVRDPATSTLRDVVRRDPARVVPVDVEDGWVLRDIDTPADLRAAQGALANDVPATLLMARHRSRRAYSDEPVSDRQLEWLVDSARHASTSSFIQAYSIVAVREPDRKAEVAKLCADQRHIHQAPVFLAICADLAKLGVACDRHGKSLHTDSLEVFVEATVDASLVGQNIQLAAESEGLGSCMIGAARNHPIALAELLGLPRHVYVVFGMTLGWPGDDPLPRDRMPLGAVLHRERYDTSGLDSALDDADEAMRDWARRTNARGTTAKPIDETRGWTDRMAWLFGRGAPKGRERLMEELRRLGFGIRAASDNDTDRSGG